jgi:hypothetical protein
MQLNLALGSDQLRMNADLLHDSLRRLVPHVDIARIALTAGVAIGIHVEVTRGEQGRGPAAEDIDFVAQDVDAVRPVLLTPNGSAGPVRMRSRARVVTRVRTPPWPSTLRHNLDSARAHA